MWKSRSPSWAPRPKYSRYGLCGRTATLNWTLATTQRLAFIFKSTAKLEAVYILSARLPAPSIRVTAPCPVKREVGRTSGAFKCSFVLVWHWPTCSPRDFHQSMWPSSHYTEVEQLVSWVPDKSANIYRIMRPAFLGCTDTWLPYLPVSFRCS